MQLLKYMIINNRNDVFSYCILRNFSSLYILLYLSSNIKLK